MRDEWATQVEALRVAFEKPLDVFEAAETAGRVADAGHGAAVLSGHDKLRAFKRDLLSMGMTSAQAHDVISSATPANGAKKPADAGAGTTPGAGAPAPGVDKTPPANNNSSSGSAAA